MCIAKDYTDNKMGNVKTKSRFHQINSYVK